MECKVGKKYVITRKLGMGAHGDVYVGIILE